MPPRLMPGLLLASTLLMAVSVAAQEPYEARAARLQPQDIPALLEKAQAGDLPSEVLLWLAYSGGHGVPKDIQKGVPWLRKAAEQGSLESQFVLSTIYGFGKGGVPVDHAEANKWLLKAAQGGHMIAQHNLGTAYLDAIGVPQDFQQARYWLTRAAEQGFAHSEWLLGRMYLQGTGVPVNRAEAEKWLSKAIAQGHSPAMMTLADSYTDPNGVPQNPQLVFDLHRAAAQRGNHFSEFELGRIYRAGYLGGPDYAQARFWFSKAAMAGYAPADFELGRMYEAGQGAAADPEQARAHYERAAGLGVSEAIQRLGEMYRDGQSVSADPVAAAMWFTIAAKMGATEGRDALQAIASRASPAEMHIASAQANTWAIEHPDAMKQKAGHFVFQGWTMVERGPQPSRGPSTAEERAYALQLTRRLEHDPLSLDAAAARAWLDEWWDEIPDVQVRPCNLIDSPHHDPNPYSTELYKQVTYSEGAFILQNPGKPTNWELAFLAGLEGALRAYEAVVAQQPSAKSIFLDDLVAQRESGRLPLTLQTLVRERCK